MSNLEAAPAEESAAGHARVHASRGGEASAG